MKKFIVVLLFLLAGCLEPGHTCVKLKIVCENGRDYFVERCVQKSGSHYTDEFIEKPSPIRVGDCKIKQIVIVKVGVV